MADLKAHSKSGINLVSKDHSTALSAGGSEASLQHFWLGCKMLNVHRGRGPSRSVLKCENYLWASAGHIPSPFSLPTAAVSTFSVLLRSTSQLRPLLTPQLTMLSLATFCRSTWGWVPWSQRPTTPGESKIQEGSGGRRVGKNSGLMTPPPPNWDSS